MVLAWWDTPLLVGVDDNRKDWEQHQQMKIGAMLIKTKTIMVDDRDVG